MVWVGGWGDLDAEYTGYVWYLGMGGWDLDGEYTGYVWYGWVG